MIIQVCKVEDDFLNEKSSWFVDLDNGERIWQDDDRPGADPASAWKRLKLYVETNKYKIVQVYLKFRSHVECPLPANAQGYFFTHALLAQFGAIDTLRYFVVGYVDGDVVHVSKWQVPEIIEIEKEDRKLADVNPELIIFNS